MAEMPRDHRPTKSLRVLLAEEDAGASGSGLALLLGLQEDIEVVARPGRGEDLVTATLTSRPHVALLDLELPDGCGLQAATALRDEAPDCRVLLLTPSARPGLLDRALEAGAAGLVLRHLPIEGITDAIRRSLTGEQVFDPIFGTHSPEPPAPGTA
ncbi:response regulator [Streptomyces sp. NPDC006879]|uniref:response regulator n=1 Tax=Streptomyces sp. NPDC006879 TaxID=3364767 RepID=UPI003685AEF4